MDKITYQSFLKSWLLKMVFTNKLWNIVIIILTFVFTFTSFSAFAQSATNPINLRISKVQKDGQDVNTTLISPNNWQFDGVLNDTDAIKYQWSGVDLQVKFRSTPARSGGFLKVYLNDDLSEENFITDTGADEYPLRIEKIKDRLEIGQNKLMFVYIDDKLRPANPPTKVVFTFNYKQGKAEPELSIIKPADGEIFVQNSNKKIEVEISNFNLGSDLNQEEGKLNILYQIKAQEPILLTSLPNGLEKITRIDANKILVSITSENISKIKDLPDSLDGQLVFQLQSGSNAPVVSQKVTIKTNYNNSVDVGLPKIEFVEPSPNNKDTEVNGNRNFILNITNFKLLDQAPTGGDEAKPGEGFLQIFINDKPMQTFWNKTQFSLNEIGYTQTQQIAINIKAQLVDTNFNRLSPEAKSEVAVIFIPETNQNAQTSSAQSSNWRLIVIAIIVLVIIAGTVFLIVRG